MHPRRLINREYLPLGFYATETAVLGPSNATVLGLPNTSLF